MHEFDPLDGALLIDKPAGPTSHDVVEHLRRQLGIKKTGHCGTLDPAATGLLILLLGRGTKLYEKLMSDDKVYAGWIKFGEPRWPVPHCTVEKVVQPKEGLLVLFPSYMWHGTIPFSQGDRLTAPFDVVPA